MNAIGGVRSENARGLKAVQVSQTVEVRRPFELSAYTRTSSKVDFFKCL